MTTVPTTKGNLMYIPDLEQAVEDRRIEVAVSVFNMGSIDEKFGHAKRLFALEDNLGRMIVPILHLDMHGDEIYSFSDLDRFRHITPGIHIHSMLPLEQDPFANQLNQLFRFKQHRGGDISYFFHPSLVPDWVGFAKKVEAEADILPFGVIDHNTFPMLYAEGSPLFDPALFRGVMVMTVKYGQSRQSYMPEAEETIRLIRQRMHYAQQLWVDGGINDRTVPLHLGIDGVVSASYLVSAKNPAEAVRKLNHPEIAIGCDHAGYELKQKIISYLREQGKTVFDAGTYTSKPSERTDYPLYACAVGNMLVKERDGIGYIETEERADKGILICGTGTGMVIAANRLPGVRAALGVNEEITKLSREHNNSNVLCLGARFIEPEQAYKLIDTWLAAEYEGGRHDRRLALIDEPE